MTGPKSGARLRAVAAEVVHAVAGSGRSLDTALAEHDEGVAAERLRGTFVLAFKSGLR